MHWCLLSHNTLQHADYILLICCMHMYMVGRDGKEAHCTIFYQYADKKRLDRMIQKDEQGLKNPDNIRSNIAKLNYMVSYLENDVDCRRVAALRYFGEQFDPHLCGRMCDNCHNQQPSTKRDVRIEAQILLGIIAELRANQVDPKQSLVTEIARGSHTKSMEAFTELRGYGKINSKNYSNQDVQRILHQLIQVGAVAEYTKLSKSLVPQDVHYLNLGPNAQVSNSRC